MINLVFKQKFLKICHLWYCEDVSIILKMIQKKDFDILSVHGINSQVDSKYLIASVQYTYLTNLDIGEEQVYKEIGKNFRYEIRRAEKEQLSYRFYNSEDIKSSSEVMHLYAKLYKEMYAGKGISMELNQAYLEDYIKNNILFVSFVYSGDTAIGVHSYIISKEDARLHNSATVFRNSDFDSAFLGRANKWHHWQDLKHFISLNYKEFDWGGISSPDEPNGIDQFKKEFGGVLIKKNYYLLGVSLKGKLAIFYMKLLKKLRNR